MSSTGSAAANRGPSEASSSARSSVRWNFSFGLIDGTFFGLYLVLADVNLVIPWLLGQLTTSRTIVGLAPTITIVGSSLLQIVAARVVQTDTRRKRYVLRFSALRVLSLCLMLPFLFLELASPAVTLAVVLLSYTLASFATAFTAMPWQEMIARTIPSNRLSSFFGLRSFLGGILGLGGAYFVRSYLGAVQTVPLYKFGVVFALAIVSISLAAGSNWPIREVTGPARPVKLPLFRQVGEAAAQSWGDPSFRPYLIARALLMVTSLASPFYILEGRAKYGVLAESIGTYTMAGLIAGIGASLVWSLLGDRLGLSWLCRAVAALSLAPPVLALAMPWVSVALGSFGGWLAVFVLLGAATTGQQNVNFRGVLELPPPENRGQMIAFGNTFGGLVSLLGPFLGLLADVAGVSAAFGLAAAASLAVVLSAGAMRKRPYPGPIGRVPA